MSASEASPAPRAKVEAARKVIQKPGELFDVAEGHLVAMQALGFREHVFDGDDGPVTVAEVAVVDLDGDEPRPLAVLEITWKRVVRQLRIAEPGSWQIGTLVEEPEYHAKELEPPGRERRPGRDRREARPVAGGLARRAEAARDRGRGLTRRRPAGDDIPF